MNSFEYAIKMESDGEAFYREEALKNKDNKLYQIFISLAEDEKRHARIIRDKQAGNSYILVEEGVTTAKNVFSDATELDFKKSTTEQVDAYKKALDMEEKSIDLYKKLLSESEKDKEFYEFLIKQEEEHYKLFDEIVKMVNRPNEWVEAAEFGLRERY